MGGNRVNPFDPFEPHIINRRAKGAIQKFRENWVTIFEVFEQNGCEIINKKKDGHPNHTGFPLKLCPLFNRSKIIIVRSYFKRERFKKNKRGAKECKRIRKNKKKIYSRKKSYVRFEKIFKFFFQFGRNGRGTISMENRNLLVIISLNKSCHVKYKLNIFQSNPKF
ncbi:hypothetical protein BpHYR1_024890 [Brachionus plicatilis]|uniref:Uncharacterized protein n=1 Tax=Brachionus plicatilis TaxID=10195 RepID=A0A3M7PG25_BRAPC|nr:hypothetical protein BpHYR1_024890 [Brachionus plicatilis]